MAIELQTTTADKVALLSQLAVAGLQSQHTRRQYASRIKQFVESGGQLNRESVQQYLDWLRDEGAGSVTLNVTLAAIKRLAEEARVRGLIEWQAAQAITSIKSQKIKGLRVGNWLTVDGLRELVKLPDRSTEVGKRDAAVMALLAGCGLRRSEASEVTWAHYQQRDGRQCIVDLEGKGQRVRTVPVPKWAEADLNAHRANVKDGGQQILGGLTESGVWWVVKQYADRLGVSIRPHDLRRTIAKLMHKNGADLTQIQMFLGHSELKTTQRYLGGGQELELGSACVDCVDIDDRGE